MARLIDADLAIERAKNSDKIVGSSIWETGEVVEFLEDCPIVDAVEVVHGWWQFVEQRFYHGGFVNLFRCSECKVATDRDSIYCPNCGAKMDGERKGNG